MTEATEAERIDVGNHSRSSMARAGALLSGAGLLSRGLGWLRLIVITALFGASPELDAYFVAFRLPDALFQLLAGGVIGSVLVPAIAGRLRHGFEAAWRTVSGVANVLLVSLVALTAVAFVAAPILVPAIAPGFSGAQLSLAVDLTRVMLISPICFLLGAVASSVLHSHGHFAASGIAPLAYNTAIIAAALVLGAQLGVMALALGVAAGAISFLVIQLLALWRRTTFRPLAVSWREPGVGPALRSLAPRSLGLAGTQLVFIVNTALASTLGIGAVTAYTIAFALLLIPVGLVGAPLGLVLFPPLARAAADGSVDAFRRDLLGAMRFTLWSAALLTALAVVLHRPLVELLFGHGALDRQTLDAVAATVIVMFLGIGAHSINLVAPRAFYAWGDTRTPVLLTLAQVVLTVIVGLVAVDPLGLPGLALAVAIGSWAKAIVLLMLLAIDRQLLDGRQLLYGSTLSVIAALPAGIVAWAVTFGAQQLLPTTLPTTLHSGAIVLIAGLAGMAIFVAVSRALGLVEVARSIQLARLVLRGR